MSKTIFITLNNSGGDPGPYNLTLIDGVGNETAWPSNPVTKAVLIAGYQMVVPDLIVKVKVQSKTCTTYIELIIPTTQCPCRVVNFNGTQQGTGNFTFTGCNAVDITDINVGNIVLPFCVDTTKPITKVSGYGNYFDTGVCCSGGPIPLPTTTTSTTSSTTTSSSTTSTTSSSTTSTTSTTTTTTIGCAQFSLFGGSGQGRTFTYTPCGGTSTVTKVVAGGDEDGDCIKLPYFHAGAVNNGPC